MVALKKKVCFVIGGLAFGGQERALATLANALSDSGTSVSIICLFKTEVVFTLCPSIHVYCPEIDRQSTSKYLYVLRIIVHVRRVIREIRPDSIVSFGDWYNAFVLFSTFGMGVKVHIASRMGPNLFLGLFHELANRCLYRFAEAVVVQTDRAREIMGTRYACRKIVVIPNGVETYTRTASRSDTRKSIVSVGRLSREKGHEVLLRAFDSANLHSWRLELVGDGPERKNLEKLANELRLDDRIIFHGNRSEIWSILEKAAIFCLPSYYEGFPNALVEAMSVPVCSIASDCTAGPREIIQHAHDGFLFAPGDHNELAGLLANLAEDEELRVRTAECGLSVRSTYSIETAARRWKDLLDFGN